MAKIKFTKKTVEALPLPSKGVAYYYDSECKGLAVSVGRTGRINFLLYRKIDGRPTRQGLGPFPDLPIEEARRRASEINGRIAAGLFTAPTSTKKQSFRQAFQRFYDEYSSIHKITHAEDLAHFERHIARGAGAHFVDKPIDQVSADDLRRFHRTLGNAGKRTTANRMIALVSAIFTRMRKWGHFAGANPCESVEKYPERSRERFVLPGSEMDRFLAALHAEADDRDFFLLALLTGARKSNVMAMQWGTVDISGGVWTIPRTKNGDSQAVHLSSEASEILVRRREEWLAHGANTPYVFPGNGASGHLVEPKKAWQRVLSRATALGVVELVVQMTESSEQVRSILTEEALLAPIKLISRFEADNNLDLSSIDMRDLHIHDLRRTMGSFLASRGVSLTIIGKVLNHRSSASTQIYARLWPAAVRDAVEGAGKQMMSHQL